MINKGRRWPVRIALALSTLLVFASAGCRGCTDTGGGTGRENGGKETPGEETVHLCCSEGPPQGYVKIDDSWSPTSCGDPTDSNVRNECTYQKYNNKPVGAVMKICSDQAIPAGWEPAPDNSTNSEGKQWSSTTCGSPPTEQLNVLKIKRTS